MSDKNFYFFRTELRKKLGRILFYPQNIDEYISDIVKLLEDNEKYFDEFIDNSTKNEKEMLIKIMNYLKDTHANTSIVKTLEKHDKTVW